MLLGLVHPTRGEIDIFGKRMNPKNKMEILRSIGSLIESPSYYGHLTAKENLRIYQTILDLPKQNIDEVLRIQSEGRQKRREAEVRLTELEDQLKNKLLETSYR